MADEDWRTFFILCAELLGRGDGRRMHTKSFCAFTVFDRLESDLNYWQHGLPLRDEIGDISISDGGVWGQPFYFGQLAHIIIPRRFSVEQFDDGRLSTGYLNIEQDIDALSAALTSHTIAHRLTELVLEIKLY